MLVGLLIRNIVLIDKLSLQFDSGLWALTGETGAGKSILLDALGLAVGGRASRNLVRSGEEEGVVTAEFALPPTHPVWVLLSDQGLGAEPELILRRIQNRDGRSRAFINDQPVSIGTLRAVGDTILEIHGQHDERGLLEPAAHRGLLDDFGGLADLAQSAADTFANWREQCRRLDEHRQKLAQAAEDEDYLRHAVEELETLCLEDGEEERLAEKRTSLMNAEKVAVDLNEAVSVLTGGTSLESRLSGALKGLERAAAKAPGILEEAISALDRALMEVSEAKSAVRETLDGLDYDEAHLENVEERLFTLRAVARKYQVPVTNLSALHEKMARHLNEIEAGEAGLAVLEQKVDQARQAYEDICRTLTDRRRAAALKIDAIIARELKPLKLDKATFKTSVEALPPEKEGPDGQDQVRFLISTNPGAPLGPLAQIASGGELVRFVLALKVALARKGEATTLIFDEVDSGVGGAVADAVGERLARLAKSAQVLVVTHSPQVAARADRHLQVLKSGTRRTVTTVSPLSSTQREEEIARMLSAAKVTDEARAAAASLLAASGERPPKTGTDG